jgi:hypothetical protein
MAHDSEESHRCRSHSIWYRLPVGRGLELLKIATKNHTRPKEVRFVESGFSRRTSAGILLGSCVPGFLNISSVTFRVFRCRWGGTERLPPSDPLRRSRETSIGRT